MMKPAKVRNLVLDGFESALFGPERFCYNLMSTDFKVVTVSDQDVTGALKAEPVAHKVVRAELPDTLDPEEFAKAQDTDLTIFLDVGLQAATGRVTDRPNPDTMVSDTNLVDRLFAMVDASVSVQVRDREGKVVFNSVKNRDPFQYYKSSSDRLKVLGASSARDLELYVVSPEFEEQIRNAVALGSASYLRKLRTHISGSYVEADKK